MFSATTLSRLLLAASALVPTAFGAETPASAETLPATVVTASREPAAPKATPTSPDVAEVRAALFATPGAVNITTADAVDRGQAAYLRDLLANQPGVFIQARHGQAESRVSIRGSGMQRTFHGRGLVISQDGLPMNYADGAFDMQAFDPAAYAYSRVWRGANGFAESGGSAALGGVIDFTSYTGHTGDSGRVRVEAGSFDSYRFVGSGATEGRLGDVFGAYSCTTTGGYRDQSAGTDQHVNINIGTPLAKHVENRVYFGYTRTDSELPGNLTKAQLNDDPRQANLANATYDNQRNFDWYRIADRVVAEFADGRAEIAGGYQYKDLDHPISFGAPGFVADNLGSSIQVKSHDFFALARLDFTGDVLDQKNRLSLGVTPSYGFLNDDRYTNPRGSAARGVLKNKFEDTAVNVGAFVENDHYVTKQVAVTAGVRADWNRREHEIPFAAASFSTPVTDARAKDYFGVSPRLGARYEFDEKRQTVFTNLSRSFEAPTFAEFNTSRAAWNPSLDAQTATTAELGYRGERAFVGWDATVYQSWVNNELISLQTQAGGGAVTRNADDTLHRGLELGLTLNLLGTPVTDAPGAPRTQKLLLRQVAGWNDFRFRDDAEFGNNRIAGLPEGVYRAELVYEHPNGLYFGPNMEIASTSWVDHSNTLAADAYVIFGFKAGYRPAGKGWAVFGEVRNLTDERYAATTDAVRLAPAGYAGFLPGNGASVTAGVECRW